MNVDARARLRDVALLALIVIYCAGILLADLTVWPGRTPTILLAIPIVAVALKKPPQFVIAAAVLAIIVDALDIAEEHPPLTLWGITFLALVAVGFLATFIALDRQQAIERERQKEMMVNAVEQLRQPLTVIIGYAQLLCTRPDLPASAVAPLERSLLAARRLKQQIDQLLAGSVDLSA